LYSTRCRCISSTSFAAEPSTGLFMADERQQVFEFRATVEPRQGQTQGMVERAPLCARCLFHGLGPAPPSADIPWFGRQMLNRLFQESGILDHGCDRPADDGPPPVNVGENFQVGAHGKPEGFAPVDVS